MPEFIDEELLYDIYTEIKDRFKLNDSVAKQIALQLPNTLVDLFMIPTFGDATLREKGEAIISVINRFVKDNNLEYNELDVAFDLFFSKDKTSIKEFEFERLSEYVTTANRTLQMDEEISTKNVIAYLVTNGLLQLDYGNIINVTRSGIDFDIKIVGYYDNGINIKYGPKIEKYLCDNLYNIYAFSYGRSPFSYLSDEFEAIIEEQTKKHKRYLFIFDMDQTIVDTDKFRVRRRKKDFNLTSDEIDDIKFIEGFEDLFLNTKSKLSLTKNDAIIITSAQKSYAESILNGKRKIYPVLKNVPAYRPDNKVEFINNFIKEKSINREDIIAFGDDEKDALIYSICNIPYYIVSNYYGYDIAEDIISKIKFPKETDFRKQFLYDIIKIGRTNYVDLDSEYFDDLVVYFRRYYDKKSIIGYTNMPEFDDRKPLSKLTYANFGSDKKVRYYTHKNSFILEDYRELEVDKQTIFVKVPGSNEKVYDEKSPCSLLIKDLCNKYGKDKDYSNLLIRWVSLPASHGGGTKHSSSVHYGTIKVTRNIKGKVVYLFDDILTSGSQMMACVERLYEAGASHVVCFVLAKTCPEITYPIVDIYGNRRWR